MLDTFKFGDNAYKSLYVFEGRAPSVATSDICKARQYSKTDRSKNIRNFLVELYDRSLVNQKWPSEARDLLQWRREAEEEISKIFKSAERNPIRVVIGRRTKTSTWL